MSTATPNIVISGTGVAAPEHVLTNAEMVGAFNQFVRAYNTKHQEAIANGTLDALQESSAEFIEKASGIKARHVIDKAGLMDPDVLCPQLKKRSADEPSYMAELGLKAARQAIADAGIAPQDIDAVLVSTSGPERPYPAIAIEIQQLLGIDGAYGFDMNAACASSSFALHTAHSIIAAHNAKTVLVINPEILSSHTNYRDRDSHFILADAAAALVVQDAAIAKGPGQYEVLGVRLMSQYSNNIRNNFGFLERCYPKKSSNGTANGYSPDWHTDALFVQQGRKVFREVSLMVSDFVKNHLATSNIPISSLERLWLHQANKNMNLLIASKILERTPDEKEMPLVLDRYGNTGGAGVAIAFHEFKDDLDIGAYGIICSFGGGYTIGNIIVRKAS